MRLNGNEEPPIQIDHVNRPAAPSQPIYTHIPENPPIFHYGNTLSEQSIQETFKKTDHDSNPQLQHESAARYQLR